MIELEVQFSADLFSKNQVATASCDNSQLQQKTVKLDGSKKKRFQVAIPILKANEVSGTQEVAIDFLVNTKKIESVLRKVPLPKPRPIASFTVKQINGKLEKWTKPKTSQLAGFVELNLQIVPTDPSTIGMPVRFELAGSNGLLLSSSEHVLAKVGDKLIRRISFEQAEGLKDPLISVQAFDASRNPEMSLGMEQVVLSNMLLPEPAKTQVSITVKSVETPVWVDLQNNRVHTVAHCELFVDGPIPGKETRLICQGVEKISPSEFNSGRQTLSLFIETSLLDGQTKTLPLFFSVEADANAAIVLELLKDSIDVTIPTPESVKLVLIDESGYQARALHSRGEEFANVIINPLLVGPLTEEAFHNAGPLEVRMGSAVLSQPLEPRTISLPFEGARHVLFEQTEVISLQLSMPDAETVATQTLDVQISRSSLLSLWIGKYSLFAAGLVILVLFAGAMILIFKKSANPDFSVMGSEQEQNLSSTGNNSLDRL